MIISGDADDPQQSNIDARPADGILSILMGHDVAPRHSFIEARAIHVKNLDTRIRLKVVLCAGGSPAVVADPDLGAVAGV